MKSIQRILETERMLKDRYNVGSIMGVPENDPDLIKLREYLKPKVEVKTEVKPTIRTLQRAEKIKALEDEGMTVEQIAGILHTSKAKIKYQIMYYKKIGIY